MPGFGTPALAGNVGSVTSLVVPRPNDLFDGCLVLLAARSQDGNNAVPWTPPAGFQLLSAAPVLPSNAYRVGEIWWKVVEDASAEPASYALSGPTGRNIGIAVRYDPDPTQQGVVETVGAAAYGGGTNSSAVVTVPARTITEQPAISFWFMAAECVAGISHVPTATPTGYTMIANWQSSLDQSTTGSRTAGWFGYKVETSTAIPQYVAGFNGASSGAVYTGSIAGGLEVVPTPIGIPLELPDGKLVYLSYIGDDGVRRAPASLRTVHEEFLVADMLATPGVTMGHRGASAVAGMPEMSRRAYRYTASKRGYRMLEFSTNRTSDGVYIGCHDASINRTSELAEGTLPNLSAMTWAQVQAYMNTRNSGGAPAPYYRLEDFLDEFTPEATVHVDPKYNTGGVEAFLDVLDAHGGPEKIVLKYVGITSGASALADAARARGYLAAAYVYAADWSAGLIEQWQSRWDILGMEWNAAAEVWSRTTEGAYPGLRSYGKPVLAHIIPNQAAYDSVAAKIAEGGWLNTPGHSWIAQVSGTESVASVF